MDIEDIVFDGCGSTFQEWKTYSDGVKAELSKIEEDIGNCSLFLKDRSQLSYSTDGKKLYCEEHGEHILPQG